MKTNFLKFFESTVPVKDRVPFWRKVAYGLGGPVEGMAAWVPQGNLTPVFNIGFGVNPALLGLVLMVWRAWDACTDLYMGNTSDNARTPWGRRRPFIVVGALLTGLTMPLIWWAPAGMVEWKTVAWLIATGMIFYTCFSIWAMPYYSLQLEMSADYNERTNISSYRAYAQLLMSLGGGWILALAARPLFSTHPDGSPDLVNGMRHIVFGLALLTIVLGVLPGIFVKERYYAKDTSKQPKENIWTGLKQTLSTRPFLYIVAIVFFETFGFSLIGTLGFYLNAYYACRGNIVLATTIAGVSSSMLFAPNLLAIPFCTWMANKFGKKIMLYIIVMSAMAGTLSMFIFITPNNPWLQLIPLLFIGPTGLGLWLIVPSMQADVADYDELITGFNVSHGAHQPLQVLSNLKHIYIGIPLVFLTVCLFAISRYELTHERMLEIRRQLEARRGVI